MAQQHDQNPGYLPMMMLPACQLRFSYDPQFERDLRAILVRAARAGLPCQSVNIRYYIPLGVQPTYMMPVPDLQVRLDINEADLKFVCGEHKKLSALGDSIEASHIHPRFNLVHDRINALRARISVELRCLEYKIRVHVALRYHIQVMSSYHSIGFDTTPLEVIYASSRALLANCPWGNCLGHVIIREENRGNGGDGGVGDDGGDGDDGDDGGDGGDGGDSPAHSSGNVNVNGDAPVVAQG